MPIVERLLASEEGVSSHVGLWQRRVYQEVVIN